jgi:disulfide oxidoreductase YuzD
MEPENLVSTSQRPTCWSDVMAARKLVPTSKKMQYITITNSAPTPKKSMMHHHYKDQHYIKKMLLCKVVVKTVLVRKMFGV